MGKEAGLDSISFLLVYICIFSILKYIYALDVHSFIVSWPFPSMIYYSILMKQFIFHRQIRYKPCVHGVQCNLTYASMVLVTNLQAALISVITFPYNLFFDLFLTIKIFIIMNVICLMFLLSKIGRCWQ